MRRRLTKSGRRAEILKTTRRLIEERGLADIGMEDIRLACGISRGGLYHHFQHKRAVLDGLVQEEVARLAEVLDKDPRPPIPALLHAGSTHLGADTGVLAALNTQDEKTDYLSALDEAFDAILRQALSDRLVAHVRPDTRPDHVAELFLTVSAHINRREILGHWSAAESAGFAATALAAIAPLLKAPDELDATLTELRKMAAT